MDQANFEKALAIRWAMKNALGEQYLRCISSLAGALINDDIAAVSFIQINLDTIIPAVRAWVAEHGSLATQAKFKEVENETINKY